MVDGTYDLILKTPMGTKKGELILNVLDGLLSGAIIIKGVENFFDGGAVNGE